MEVKLIMRLFKLHQTRKKTQRKQELLQQITNTEFESILYINLFNPNEAYPRQTLIEPNGDATFRKLYGN